MVLLLQGGDADVEVFDLSPDGPHCCRGHVLGQLQHNMAASVRAHATWPPVSGYTQHGRQSQGTHNMAARVRVHTTWLLLEGAPSIKHTVRTAPCLGATSIKHTV